MNWFYVMKFNWIPFVGFFLLHTFAFGLLIIRLTWIWFVNWHPNMASTCLLIFWLFFFNTLVKNCPLHQENEFNRVCVCMSHIEIKILILAFFWVCLFHLFWGGWLRLHYAMIETCIGLVCSYTEDLLFTLFFSVILTFEFGIFCPCLNWLIFIYKYLSLCFVWIIDFESGLLGSCYPFWVGFCILISKRSLVCSCLDLTLLYLLSVHNLYFS